jgi:hypothetical protein
MPALGLNDPVDQGLVEKFFTKKLQIMQKTEMINFIN